MTKFEVRPIGTINAREDGTFQVELAAQYIPALQALEGFSHLHLLWWFSEHDTPEARAVLEVPAPYRTAPDVMGIFATRAPVRPNPLALSVVEVLAIDYEKGDIHIPYTDAHDGTPLLDIKPYTPSMDRIEAPGVPAWCSHWPVSYEASGEFDWAGEFTF